MFIHEYQAKELLSRVFIPIPRGKVVENIDDAFSYINSHSFESYTVKAQIHGGGRGKAGGIRITDSKEKAVEAVRSILGKRLTTAQTGPGGRIVRKILIEEGIKIDREIYIALTIDRKKACPIVMGSPEGGMDIEGRKVFKEDITTQRGLYPFQKRRLAYSLGLGDKVNEFGSMLEGLYQIFLNYDATLIEINPIAVNKEGRLVALDAKMVFDDNGLFRQKFIRELRDPGESSALEDEAFLESLNYVMLDGNIGCLVNGAGLAMATIDLIEHYGGRAANFLDVGGGASSEKIEKAIRILLEDKRMKILLINIFGGILRCDRFAEGMVRALSTVEAGIRIVIRFKGTMIEQGKETIRNSGLKPIWTSSMEEAVKMAVGNVNTDK